MKPLSLIISLALLLSGCATNPKSPCCTTAVTTKEPRVEKPAEPPTHLHLANTLATYFKNSQTL